jgi:hypothetical protein
LKLKYEEALSNFTFNFNLRRYSEAADVYDLFAEAGVRMGAVLAAGAYTRPLLGSSQTVLSLNLNHEITLRIQQRVLTLS